MENSNGIKMKFCSHQKHVYKDNELLVNIKDLGPNVKEGDIIEIYQLEEDEHQPRLLLQIPHYNTISVDQNIASTFQLRSYKDVIVNKVDPKSVALELLELTFKDQYLGRSDMWRLKKSLINTVVYLKKTIEFCNKSIRCQTYEMWVLGEKVACGVVTEDTKIVFRSSTCQAYLFIQMSSEMWEFDMYGDLYFEKAVNGFLADLFTKWLNEKCNHDVTIVLFSRTYYKASSIEEFPPYMRECLLQDYQGRFYEDFYRVAVQSERYEDWMPILSLLRQLFHRYLDDVLNYHASPEYDIPEAYNSNAPQGNFLEVLNISLNVFEKHYLDRSFERTGQMSVVVTPGVGVFEVDRELTNITKQRIIDNGVGSDLVCLGEQPLHAVPLLKFHRKRDSFKSDDYSMPHTWINLSFYSSKKRVPGSGEFVPRIKVPQDILKLIEDEGENPIFATINTTNWRTSGCGDEHSFPNSVFDYDAYDAQIIGSMSNNVDNVSNILGKSPAINIPSKMSDGKTCSHSFGALNIEGVNLNDKKFSSQSEFEDISSSIVNKIGSSGTGSPNEFSQAAVHKVPLRPGRSLINPFNPSHVTIKLTSNRRRWIHTFPKGPTGVLIQQHHYQVSPINISDDDEDGSTDSFGGGDLEELKLKNRHNDHRSRDSLNVDEAILNDRPLPPSGRKCTSSINEGAGYHPAGVSVSSSVASTRGTNSPQKVPLYSQGVQPPPMPGLAPNSASMQINKQATLLWGATGEQEWKAEITTGVDWKSLTLPACLPLTTDYFPDKQSLQYDYEVAANYSRLPDAFHDIFNEMVSQRLSQGFQLIMRPEDHTLSNQRQNSLMRSRRSKTEEVLEEYRLSIGRVFHWLQCKDSSIDVTIYRPKHPYPPLERKYKFRFRSPYLSQYEISWVEFKTERLENYKWNNLDSYISFKGDPKECKLVEEFKYWRFRLMVLPDLYKTEMKKIFESPPNSPCDIYHSLSPEEQQGGRERLGSVRHSERPRIRTGGKVPSEKVRYESGNNKERNDDTVRAHNDVIRAHNDADEDHLKDEGELLRKLNLGMNRSAIVEAMKDPSTGIPFVSSSCTQSNTTTSNSSVSSLPQFCFISYDATAWVLKRFEDVHTIEGALELFQDLIEKNFVRHASNNCQKTFIRGFHLYYFITENEKVNVDPSVFEAEWHEITFDPLPVRTMNVNNLITNGNSDPSTPSTEPQIPPFLMPEVACNNNGNNESHTSAVTNGVNGSCQRILFKNVSQVGYMEIDDNMKSDRLEWGHLEYQTTYSPLRGYEFVIQWMCATGPLVNDLAYHKLY
ncbi:DEP domain-containing protein 5 [Armadillidium nasatum]|uniref:DEP domain-containing protein 5 n=1 Tax=Armadillidium nasatum TaxID=96803 RepID=A0A5N5T986_9CRUS|nr:DEP domain-containing protein 5 [Armadillidium nasatum]